MSINAHKHLTQSRRDDLISMGYMLVDFLLQGGLSWESIDYDSHDKGNSEIQEAKELTSNQVLCEGLPEEFVALLDYVQALEFDETPNYDLLKALFKSIGEKNLVCFDNEVLGWPVRS